MSLPGICISISGCDSIKKRKLELYRDKHPDLQFFFVQIPDIKCDICVLPCYDLVSFFERPGLNRFLLPPVIAFGAPGDMPAATAYGCSDFLCDPWEPVELHERAARCFRTTIISCGKVSLVCGNDRVLRCVEEVSQEEVQEVRLSESEYLIYRLLSGNRGMYFDRDMLSVVAGTGTEGFSRSIDMHISRLRNKIDGLLLSAGPEKGMNPVKTAFGRGWGINP